MNKITLKKTSKGTGGDYFYTLARNGMPGAIHYTLEDIYQHIASGGEVDFVNADPGTTLMRAIENHEIQRKHNEKLPQIAGDVDLANRVIRGGGFTNYLNKLA